MADDFNDDISNDEVDNIVDNGDDKLALPVTDNDNFTDVSSTSWGERIAGSFAGIIFGLLLFVAAFPLLWWNEGHSLHRIKVLDEGKNLVVAVAPDHIDPNNNGKLIYISSKATTNEILNDDIFGVHENALKLNRIVEMYQWEEKQTTETHKNIGGSETKVTNYSYDKKWSDKLISSSGFRHKDGHQNPTTMSYSSQSFSASNISAGAFGLSSNFIDKLDKFTDYQLSDQNFSTMNEQLKPYFKLNGNYYFYGDIANPQIGALRIAYKIIRPTNVSVIGKQNNGVIEPYYTKNGDIALLEMGNVVADSMFADEEDKNMMMTWLIRLGGFILMWIGSSMIFKPISVLADVLPFLGSIAGAGIGLITGIISLVLSFITIAIAWLFCRPLIAIGLLVVAVACLTGGMNLIRNAETKIKSKLIKK